MVFFGNMYSHTRTTVALPTVLLLPAYFSMASRVRPPTSVQTEIILWIVAICSMIIVAFQWIVMGNVSLR
jgi:hypothetical protein